MKECQHKFRTNLDELGESLGNTNQKIVYMTIIFCEKCGIVSYDTNKNKQPFQEVQYTPTLRIEGSAVGVFEGKNNK